MKSPRVHCLNLIPALVAAVITSASAQMALVEQGRASLARGDTDGAIQVLEKAVAQYPNSAEAHFRLFTAYGSKVQQVGLLGAMKFGPKAMAEGEKAVALDPKHGEARLGLVQAYMLAPGMMGGSADKALENAKELKAIDPLMAHRAYGFIYAQQKKLDLARKEYLDAIREQPDSPKPHTYFGQHLANVEKNYGAACAECEAALKIDANYMPAVYHLGRAAALGNLNSARAEEALKRYLAYKPKESEPPLAGAHYYLGLVYEKAGNKPEAKQSFQAALKLNPTHKEASAALKRVS
jgi:tetratricopeptide (TPR) repeat protein